MTKALEEIVKIKVPALVKEELVTEFDQLSMLRMETKRLQETQLQLFKGYGDYKPSIKSKRVVPFTIL
ncbi:hypothetical protein ACTWP4_03990 [Gracilibacillus sp. D59]|uniref:hypothetical protein n=1 Tax=Gracilibacillus sp. D59 TaxID=3457434 RepID=UPI003FCC7CD7